MSEIKLAILGGSKAIPEKLTKKMETAVKWPIISEGTILKCADMIRQGIISLPYDGVIGELEDKFKKFIGSKHCLVQNNGTSTLHAAYFALGVRPGDEVLVTSHNWITNVSPLNALGAIPVYCDIDPDTLTVDPEDIERKISSRTKAICVVHLWGNPCDMDRIMNISKKHNIQVIEDCSHAHGATYKGKKVGSIGAIGCFSMQGSKSLPGGELGAIVTDSDEYFDQIVILGHQGRIQNTALNEKYREYEAGLGFKYRPFPVAARIALDQLEALKETNARRVYMVNCYNKELENIQNIKTVKQLPDTERVCYSYVFIYESDKTGVSIEKFHEAMIAEGISPKIAIPMRYRMVHTVPPFDRKDIALPVTEKLVPQMFMCQPYSGLDKETIEVYTKKFAKTVEKIMKNMDLLR